MVSLQAIKQSQPCSEACTQQERPQEQRAQPPQRGTPSSQQKAHASEQKTSWCGNLPAVVITAIPNHCFSSHEVSSLRSLGSLPLTLRRGTTLLACDVTFCLSQAASTLTTGCPTQPPQKPQEQQRVQPPPRGTPSSRQKLTPGSKRYHGVGVCLLW